MNRYLWALRRALRRLYTIIVRRSFGVYNFQKQATLQAAFDRMTPPPKSVADLGGAWGHGAAYTFYALKHYPLTSAYLVDTNIEAPVRKKGSNYPQLTFIEGSFGDPEVPGQLGAVDLVVLFDVLLHQVAPDWNQILEMYAPVTRAFAIFNPQWTGSSETVRLLDLGEQEYFRNNPHPPDNELYKGLFSKLDETYEEHQRPWRDIHNIWQWGITDEDLRKKMNELGFEEIHFRHYGPYGSLRNFDNHGFVFAKKSSD